MGILEDLKRQAVQDRLAKEQEEARKAELERIYQTGIRPAMLNIHKYLIDLTEQLAAVTWSVNLSFDFPGIGKVDKLVQRDYSISIDSQRNPKFIVLRFDCVSPEDKRYTIYSKAAADDACEFLVTQKLAFSDWAIRDGSRQIIGYVIQARLRVRTSLSFEASIENGSIYVTSYNFEGVEEKTFATSYKNINDEWLDQLGHYILRKNTGFGKLDISEEERNRIRILLEEERREYELKVNSIEKEDLSEDKLLPKIRKLLTKPLR